MPCVLIFGRIKTSFMQKQPYIALKPPSASGLYRPTNSCEYVVLSLALLIITWFRGGRHQPGRWVLHGVRRVVRGSQVAALDILEHAGTGYVIVGLLGLNLDLVVLDNLFASAVVMMGQ